MRLFVFSLMLLVCRYMYSQESWKFDHIDTENGLSTGTVNCVFKDSKGFIWIGTVDGLNRYDCYTITVYKHDKNDPNSIPGNVITAIAEDANGTIWIGTRNTGISLFDWKTERFTSMHKDPQLPAGSIRTLLATHSNDMLFAIQGGGVGMFSEIDKSLRYFSSANQAISNDHVFSIIPASRNKYWISSQAGAIDLLDITTGESEQIVYSGGVDTGNRKPLLADSDGNLWIGTDGNGLYKYNIASEELTHYTVNGTGLSSNIITSIIEDKSGLIFIGTDGGGINRLDPDSEKVTYIKSNLVEKNSLSSDAIYQIYVDNSEVVWVSTYRGGVNTYSPLRTKFQHFQQIPYEENSLSYNSVIEILQTDDGYIWIGTDGGGLDRLDPETGIFRHNTHDPGLRSSISTNVAISMMEDDEGYLWIGTYAGGVNRFDRRTGVFKRFLPDPDDPSSINSRNVWSILQDANGDIWFGLLDGGLDKYNPSNETFEHYIADGSPGSLSSNLAFNLFEDSKGNFWVGTENRGLNLFDRTTGRFVHYMHDDNDTTTILNDNIRTLFEDSSGLLWIGTSEGANIMDLATKKISSASVNVLLPNLVINGIQEDDQRNLWIATNKGLSKYNRQSQKIQNFTVADGLQGSEFNYASSIKAADGTMYFGGPKGMNVFDPKEVKLNAFNPNVEITSIRLFDQQITEIVTKEGKPFIGVSVQYLNELNLNYDQNVIEITFSSLDFTSPNANRYRYKLEGFNDDWVNTDAHKRSASYTNLDPGNYVFRVQGTNSDGVWSDKEKTLVINVTPPWWTTWWFRTLLVSMISIMTFFFIRWRTLRVKAYKEELKKRVTEATTQVKEQNGILQAEQHNLTLAIEETNAVINQAVESGDFSARISLNGKSGQWLQLGQSINTLFETIVVPFHSINEIIDAMSESDLTKRYKEESKGDIEKITVNLNQALDNLSGLLEASIANMKEIGVASSEMLVSSEEMKVGTGEIAASTSELSSGAQNQVSRIDEASHILEALLKVSSQVNGQAQGINEAAIQGAEVSDNGKTQMTYLADSMNQILKASQEANQSIAHLSEKSNSISLLLNSIKEIAVETNMLALNAAIEAAKAGESGRGFAVVADQIRKLAENSNHFASEIENTITEIKESVNHAHQLVDNMNVDVSQSVEASQRASGAFDDLASSYAETLGFSNHIVGNSEEQHIKIKEVVKLIESVVVIAEQAAAGTEQIASSSNELSAGMSEYSNKTKTVTEIINSLNQKMQSFKVG